MVKAISLWEQLKFLRTNCVLAIMAVNGTIFIQSTAKGLETMPRLDLGNPYDYYVQTLIDMGLYSTYTEVVKDALRQHMDSHTESKRIASFHVAIAEGEADIQAGRIELYSPELIDRLTEEVLADG
jgi:putative addiction module CopG family antidote